VKPIRFAVFRFTINSNFVGLFDRQVGGLAPFQDRSTLARAVLPSLT